jgi:hypothetical protein
MASDARRRPGRAAGRRQSSRRPAEAVAWLQTNPPLEDLVEAYPEHWQRVEHDLGALIARHDKDEITAYITRVSQPQAALPDRPASDSTPRFAGR